MQLKEFWRRYSQNRVAVAGLIIASFFVLVAVFGPFVAPYSPFELTQDRFSGPSFKHPLGTDNLGRDIMSGIMYGARISIVIGFLAAATSAAIGIFVGSFAGYFGGLVDEALMRITELFQVIPRLFLAIILVAITSPSVWNVIFVIGILSWPATARIVRSQFLSLKERPFVEAARSIGVKHINIMFGEIFPNAVSPIIVNSSLEVAGAILTEASLSFLGLNDPNVISWGYMILNAGEFLRLAWWMATFPGIALFLTVLSLNLIGDGLNDALNPKLRAR